MSAQRIIDVESAELLEKLDWHDFTSHPITIADIQYVCGLYDGYWSCDPENPGRYHAEWASGKCSADFFDFAGTLRKSRFLLYWVAWHLIALAKQNGCGDFTAVVGSATGSTILAEAIAELTGTRFIKLDKTEDGKDQLWPQDQEPLTQDDVVLHIEELTSTISTPPKVRKCVNDFHAELGIYVKWMPKVFVVVDRRSAEEQAANPYPEVDDWQLVPLCQFPSKLWDPADCPMCAVHSERLRPRKEPANWSKLMGWADKERCKETKKLD